MAEAAPLSLDEIVAAWDGCLRPFENAAFSPRSDIAALIGACAQAFSSLGDFDVEQFTLGACFFSDTVVGHDDVFDYGEEQPVQVRTLLDVIPMQFESYRIFGEQLGDKPRFWSDLRRYFVEYVGAMNDELALRSDPARWQQYDEASCLRLAERKNGLVRTIAAALCAASGEDARKAAFEHVLVDVFVAYQMYDDVLDWREDVRTGNISALLRLACPTRPSPHELDAVARAIFLGRNAERVLSHGIALLESAARGADALGANALHPVIAVRSRALRTVLSGVRDELRKAPAPKPALRIIVDAMPPGAQEPLRRGLSFLGNHAGRGFWETRHWIKLGDAWGTDLPAVICGDVFARAMICEALCELRDRGVRGLESLVAAESAYLFAARRSDELAGWSYLPELPLLPPDADTTAQVLQALARAGRADAALAHAMPALELLFARARDDGAYGTWVLGAPELSETDRRRYEIVRDGFGFEPDVDVIANLSYALHAFAAPAFAEQVARSAAFVERAQHESGWWNGTWYEGTYYPTFAAVRFLAAFGRGAAVQRALRRLLADQRADGGWGENGGDSLSSALALGALALAGAGTDAETALHRGARYLAERCADDGGWEAVPFVRVFQGHAAQALASRCVTTAFVLRALASARDAASIHHTSREVEVV